MIQMRWQRETISGSAKGVLQGWGARQITKMNKASGIGKRTHIGMGKVGMVLQCPTHTIVMLLLKCEKKEKIILANLKI